MLGEVHDAVPYHEAMLLTQQEMQVVMGILKHLDENPPASKNLH